VTSISAPWSSPKKRKKKLSFPAILRWFQKKKSEREKEGHRGRFDVRLGGKKKRKKRRAEGGSIPAVDAGGSLMKMVFSANLTKTEKKRESAVRRYIPPPPTGKRRGRKKKKRKGKKRGLTVRYLRVIAEKCRVSSCSQTICREGKLQTGKKGGTKTSNAISQDFHIEGKREDLTVLS